LARSCQAICSTREPKNQRVVCQAQLASHCDNRV
jgi:hypothetical protein